MTIAVIVEFDVKLDCFAQFEAKLRQDAEETLCDDGWLRMGILYPRGTPERVVLSGPWRDDAAKAAHRARPGHTHAWQEPLVQRKCATIFKVAA